MFFGEDRHVSRDDFEPQCDRSYALMARPRPGGGGWDPRVISDPIWPRTPPEPIEEPWIQPAPDGPPTAPPAGVTPPDATGPDVQATGNPLQEQINRTRQVLDQLDAIPNIDPKIKSLVLERLLDDLLASLQNLVPPTTTPPSPPYGEPGWDPGWKPVPYDPGFDIGLKGIDIFPAASGVEALRAES